MSTQETQSSNSDSEKPTSHSDLEKTMLEVDEAFAANLEKPDSIRANVGNSFETVIQDAGEDTSVPSAESSTDHQTQQQATSQKTEERYLLVKDIARGGCGRIWLAQDTHIRREVAYKELLPKASRNRVQLSRFLVEAQITGQLEHPGIIPIYDLGYQANGVPFYSMKLVRGQTLADVIEACHALPENSSERHLAFNKLLANFIDICNTLAFAHDHKVIHRDLKPLNVMLGEFGEILVLDWGIAKLLQSDSDQAGSVRVESAVRYSISESDETIQLDDESETPNQDDTDESTEVETGEPGIDAVVLRNISTDSGDDRTQTVIGQVIGTPMYMPPEQAAGAIDELDARSDIYSLGAILYRILTNHDPIEKGKLTAVLKRVCDGQVVPMKKWEVKVEKALEAICLKALAQERDSRYSSALDLAADVEAFLADEPVSVFPEPWHVQCLRWAKRNQSMVLSTMTACLVALLIWGGIVLNQKQAAKRFERYAQVQIDSAETLFHRNDFDGALKILSQKELKVVSKFASLGTLDARIDALKQTVEQSKKTLIAQQQLNKERELKNIAEFNERKATIGRLVAESKALRKDAPVTSLLLAIKAVETSQDKNVADPQAHQNLRDTLNEVKGTGHHQHNSSVWHSAISPNGKLFATGDDDGYVRLFKINSSDPPRVSTEHHDDTKQFEKAITSLEFTPDGHWLISGANTDLVLWGPSADPSSDSSRFILHNEVDVSCIAVDPESHWLVTGDVDGGLRVWDLKSTKNGQSPQTLKSHTDSVNAVSFSDDGRWLASASEGGSIHVWNWQLAKKNEPLFELKADSAVGSLAMLPDQRLATACTDGTIHVWDLKVFDPNIAKKSLALDSGDIENIAASPSGRWLAACCNKNVRVFAIDDINSNDGNLVIELQGHRGRTTHVIFSPDEKSLFSASEDKTVIRWKLENLKESGSSTEPFQILRGHQDVLLSLDISDDGRWLVTTSLDGSARVWDLKQGQRSNADVALSGHGKAITALVINGNSKWLLSSSSDTRDNLVRWDLSSNLIQSTRTPLRFHERKINQLSVAHSKPFALTAGNDKLACLWDIDSIQPFVMNGHSKPVRTCSISPDGRWAATTDTSGKVLLWNLSIPEKLSSNALRNDGERVTTLEFSPASDLLAAGDRNGTIFLWRLSNHEPKPLTLNGRHHSASVNQVAFAPNGSQLASVSDDHSALVWDLKNEEKITWRVLAQHSDKVKCCVWGNDGAFLLTGSDDRRIIQWNLDVAAPTTQELVGHMGNVGLIALSRDGRWILSAETGGADNSSVRLWDRKSQTMKSVVLETNQEPYRAVAISDDERWLIAGRRDGTIRLWRLQISDLIDIARRSAGRDFTESELAIHQIPSADPRASSNFNLGVDRERNGASHR